MSKCIGFGPIAAKSRLALPDVELVWRFAAGPDPSLSFSSEQLAKLRSKRIAPEPYSRRRLFEHMACRRPAFFSGFPIRSSSGTSSPTSSEVVDAIRSGFPRSKRARVRSRDAVRYVPIPSVLSRWQRAQTIFGVTDLHYIGTRFDTRIDTSRLNDFNLLPRGTDGYQSQDSLVISTAGAVTDSHSDDHSGSNHSFVGSKLWLLWDTLEGFDHGLEDVEHCDVYTKAAFNLEAFLAMRTSCWILIGPGQTMFIPANLTHKVVTLEAYLGLGSFHAGLPGFIDLLLRWSRLAPRWAVAASDSDRSSVRFITNRAIRQLRRLVESSRRERDLWGIPYLQQRLQLATADRRQATGDTSHLDAFLATARRLLTVDG